MVDHEEEEEEAEEEEEEEEEEEAAAGGDENRELLEELRMELEKAGAGDAIDGWSAEVGDGGEVVYIDRDGARFDAVDIAVAAALRGANQAEEEAANEEGEAAAEEDDDQGEDDEQEATREPAKKRRRRSSTFSRWSVGSKGETPSTRDTDQDFRMIKFKARDVNTHLVCRLCDGYFQDAHTITECLHTFCKNCLLKYLKGGKAVCPRCNVHLGPHPMNAILHDRTLQTLVDKIFPFEGSAPPDDEPPPQQGGGSRRRGQTAPRARTGTPSAAGANSQPPQETTTTTAAKTHAKARPAPPRSAAPAPAPPAPAPTPSPAHPRTSSGGTAAASGAPPEGQQVSFKVEPAADETYYPTLDKPYLKTSGKLKVHQLRRYLAKKLGVSANRVELLCAGDVLASDHSLHFIRRALWYDDAVELIINYRKNDYVAENTI
ncbi:hypothetical protein CTAYLR_004403 [Chrysophaeum taylorii]|uniref:RING-type domain-containing protein n=1 Tax=Chrysophaeum taylorii TaxID=2483200 RepID=A0AAD7ULT3_9STRA|nr:hypothetical protein CTAYLR_004403 [Chrysophaeum taylorii]